MARPEAFQLLREAVAMEEELKYDEPPGWMQPVRHALGALLMAEERYKESEAVYRADLKRHPNNAWSLLGLQQALQLQEKHAEAREMQPLVKAAWARADISPIASCFCHPDARMSCCEQHKAETEKSQPVPPVQETPPTQPEE